MSPAGGEGGGVVEDLGAVVQVQEGAVVSKVVHRDERLDVTVFGFGAGEGLTEHRSTRVALLHVLRGRLRLTVDGVEHDAGPGFWLHMAEGAPHALEAVEPTVMLLTQIRQ